MQQMLGRTCLPKWPIGSSHDRLGRPANGEDQRKRTLRERRQALEHLLDGERLVLPVRRLAPDGLEAWKEVLRAGYEGLMAKDPQSPYVGGRTLKWLKVKQRGYRVEERGWSTQSS